MTLIPEDWIAELKRRAKPSEVVGKYVSLKRGSNKNELVGLSPFRADNTLGSFTVNDAKRIIHDFATGESWDVLSFIQQIKGCAFREAAEELGTIYNLSLPNRQANGLGKATHLGPITETYEYQDESGYLLYQVLRYDHGEPKKTFRQRRPNGKGGWTWNVNGVRKVPYRLPELLTLELKCIVFIVEGEKDVETLRKLSIPATTNVGGAGNWDPAINEYFRDRSVVILPDNDKPGRDHAAAVARNLNGVAETVRVVDIAAHWSECPVKGDVTDWIEAGGDLKDLKAWIKATRPWQPKDQVKAGKGPSRESPPASADKPSLVVRPESLPDTANDLCNLFAEAGCFFDRGVPVHVIAPANGELPVAQPLTVSSAVCQAHKLSRPQKYHDKALIDCTLPDRVARFYLEGKIGEWSLPPLNGVTSAPILSADGSVRSATGYDPATGLWCHAVPTVQVSPDPSEDDATAALWTVRDTFKTFPFADAATLKDETLGVNVVDLEQSPQHDESAFLAGLLTAVCRPSLELAPGLSVTAAELSGASSGKGLLVRAICAIAYSFKPDAFTAGHDGGELDKRIASRLMEAAPVLFLDNVNSTVLSSDTLASVLTERPARVRILGVSRMVLLNSSAFIAVTGNGLQLSEDLARRFLFCELDAKMEDPELRPFAPGFLGRVFARRAELLSALLTIWQWGRMKGFVKPENVKPMGSYEVWCQWVRDPLVAAGCADPAERIKRAKANDPRRQHISQIFNCWNEHHGQAAVRASDLCEEVRHMLDPNNRGSQFLVSRLSRLVGTRAANFVLIRDNPAGRWGTATYGLQITQTAGSKMA
jgi:putative DNA primase/helicase